MPCPPACLSACHESHVLILWTVNNPPNNGVSSKQQKSNQNSWCLLYPLLGMMYSETCPGFFSLQVASVHHRTLLCQLWETKRLLDLQMGAFPVLRYNCNDQLTPRFCSPRCWGLHASELLWRTWVYTNLGLHCLLWFLFRLHFILLTAQNSYKAGFSGISWTMIMWDAVLKSQFGKANLRCSWVQDCSCGESAPAWRNCSQQVLSSYC